MMPYLIAPKWQPLLPTLPAFLARLGAVFRSMHHALLVIPASEPGSSGAQVLARERTPLARQTPRGWFADLGRE